MEFDPQVEAMRDRRVADGVPPLYTQSLARARADDLAAIQAGSGTPEHVAKVTDTVNGDLRVRVYRPNDTPNLGVLVYYFGGGWTLGAIETADQVARYLANAAGIVVVVPEYRLAPEHKFPTAVHDAYAALRWVHEHADELGVSRRRVAVGGDSAGGNLAAAVTLLARKDGDVPIRAQLLVYPNTDHASTTPSATAYDQPWMFNRHSVDWYWNHYLADPADGADPLASPLREPDLSGLPSALVITAEHDPLRDQAEAYAVRMRHSGVNVIIARYPGMIHGFFCMPGEFDAGRRAQARAAKFLRASIGGQVPDPGEIHPASHLPFVVFLRPLMAGMSHIEVGEYTYYQDPEYATEFPRRNVLYAYNNERLVIGRYCSIARDTRFVMSGGNHPMLGVGTYPFGMFGGEWADETSDILQALPSRGDIVVGNNVWLGMGTLVMPGVRIGDGAVVAAGSVVIADVAPYAVVGGNPAREIRRRYTDEEVAELQRIAWWDWPVEAVTAHARTILTGDVAALRAVAEKVAASR